jgi:hypothetical protein
MLDNDVEDKNQGGRRMDKAVLINMLAKIDSRGRSTDPNLPAAQSIGKSPAELSAPGDPHEPQVPEAK